MTGNEDTLTNGRKPRAVPEDELITFDKAAKNVPCPGPYFSRSSPEILACAGIDQFVFEVFEGFFCCTIATTTEQQQAKQRQQDNNNRLSSSSSSSSDWTHKGQDMLGLADEDRVGLGDGNGAGIALASNGKILAIGSRYNDNIGSDSGLVQVYRFGDFGWQPFGSGLTGLHGGEYFGFSVALSHNGTVVAIGAVRHADKAGIYQGQVRCYRMMPKEPNDINSPRDWQQAGDALIGDDKLDHFGHSVSLSADGTILAVGATQHMGGTNLGYVHVHEWTGDGWVILGEPLMSRQGGNRFGNAVSLSDSGKIVAIGARTHSENNMPDTGMVQVMRYSSQQRHWVPMGPVLYGEGPEDQFGGCVSLAGDGYSLAVGAEHNDGGDKKRKPSSGHVRVFAYQSFSDTWQQIGHDIDGEGDGHGAGVSVSLAGNRVAVGAIFATHTEGRQNLGQVRVFEYEPRRDLWIQAGETIYGDNEGDHVGHSVALSVDGHMLAYSAPHADTSRGMDSGYVRVVEMGKPIMACQSS